MYENLMVKLPGQRGAQLKAFAEREGLGLTEAIGALLRLAGAAEPVPGFEIVNVDPNPSAPTYRLSFDGFSATLSFLAAFNLSNDITRTIEGPGNGGRRMVLPPQEKELVVARGRGTSVLIRGIDLKAGETTDRKLSIDVARDLASQIINVLPHGPKQ